MTNNRQSLAVKYRPKTFEEVCGQSVTVKVLKRAVETKNFKNCYLFAGNSGCGKTTLARIFAKEINQGLGTPIELDAASLAGEGIENVRALINSAEQRDLVSEYKIFIIDECHAFGKAAWQAFLKGIEEPSPYSIFMFCTTEPSKIPEAILNRVQRYNISSISTAEINERLKTVCKAEGYTNYEDLCDILSKTVHGCMRDALMKLDQCVDYSTDLSLDVIKPILSTLSVSYEGMFRLTWALQDKDEQTLLMTLNGLNNQGTNLKQFIELYIDFMLDLNKYRLFKDISITNIPEYLASESNSVVQHTIHRCPEGAWYNNLIDTLLKIKLETKFDSFYKTTIEAFLLQFCRA